jgi:DNA-binding NarL/FixJ family response regulator
LVVLGEGLSRAQLVQLLRFGARSCLPLHTRGREIVDAVVYAARGLGVVSEDDLVDTRRPRDFAILSSRELEVFELVCERQTNAQIAAALHLAPDTVKGHVSRILHKLGAESRYQLIGLTRQNTDPGNESAVERHPCVTRSRSRERLWSFGGFSHYEITPIGG